MIWTDRQPNQAKKPQTDFNVFLLYIKVTSWFFIKAAALHSHRSDGRKKILQMKNKRSHSFGSRTNKNDKLDEKWSF